MSRATKPSRDASHRETLRKRVKRMYDWLNQGEWAKCHSLLDPRLREQNKVDEQVYADSLRHFKEVYGKIEPWYVRLSLHLDASTNKHDDRPFAYVYVVWKDQAHAFHMFRERWVQDAGRWFTRVVGLVPNAKESVSSPE